MLRADEATSRFGDDAELEQRVAFLEARTDSRVTRDAIEIPLDFVYLPDFPKEVLLGVVGDARQGKCILSFRPCMNNKKIIRELTNAWQDECDGCSMTIPVGHPDVFVLNGGDFGTYEHVVDRCAPHHELLQYLTVNELAWSHDLRFCSFCWETSLYLNIHDLDNIQLDACRQLLSVPHSVHVPNYLQYKLALGKSFGPLVTSKISSFLYALSWPEFVVLACGLKDNEEERADAKLEGICRTWWTTTNGDA